MQVFWTKALAYIEARWHTIWGGVLASITAVIFSFLGLKIAGVFTLLPITILSVIAGVATAGFWIFSNRIPKVPEGKIGVIFGLSCDSSEQRKIVTADLFEKLRENLSTVQEEFIIIDLPEWLVTRLRKGDARKLFLKMRGHLILYGTARERNVNGKASHVLNFQGIVRHAPVPQNVTSQIVRAFAESLPKQVIIDKSNDALSFEITSDLLGLAAKYLVGLALFVSGNFQIAERLFIAVDKELRTDRIRFHTLPKRVRERLFELYDAWQGALALGYRLRREDSLLPEMDRIASRILSIKPDHYNGLLTKAICEFMLRRNVSEAHRFITLSKNDKDATWLYSRAFLHAYQEKLRDAAREYKQAAGFPHNEVTAPLQAEEFLHVLLQREPHLVQLHFCLGLINFYVKRDFVKAKEDFTAFLEKSPEKKFREARKLTEKFLAQCISSSGNRNEVELLPL